MSDALEGKQSGADMVTCKSFVTSFRFGFGNGEDGKM